MSSKKGGGSSTDTHAQQLLQRLRCCRGLERLVEKDLRELDWGKQEKVFVMLFLRIGVKALHNCAAERLADKKPMSAAERRQVSGLPRAGEGRAQGWGAMSKDGEGSRGTDSREQIEEVTGARRSRKIPKTVGRLTAPVSLVRPRKPTRSSSRSW